MAASPSGLETRTAKNKIATILKGVNNQVGVKVSKADRRQSINSLIYCCMLLVCVCVFAEAGARELCRKSLKVGVLPPAQLPSRRAAKARMWSRRFRRTTFLNPFVQSCCCCLAQVTLSDIDRVQVNGTLSSLNLTWNKFGANGAVIGKALQVRRQRFGPLICL